MDQRIHHDAVDALVIRSIVLLSQQDRVSRKQLIDFSLIWMVAMGGGSASEQANDRRNSQQ
jgi:hypothetical protein